MVVGALVVVEVEALDADEAMELDPLPERGRLVAVDRTDAEVPAPAAIVVQSGISSGDAGAARRALVGARKRFAQRRQIRLDRVVGNGVQLRLAAIAMLFRESLQAPPVAQAACHLG